MFLYLILFGTIYFILHLLRNIVEELSFRLLNKLLRYQLIDVGNRFLD